MTTAPKDIPTPGDYVNYVLPSSSRYPNEVRGAFVAKPMSADGECLNLQVLVDGTNDGAQYPLNGTAWITSVHYDPTKQPGTWHSTDD